MVELMTFVNNNDTQLPLTGDFPTIPRRIPVPSSCIICPLKGLINISPKTIP